MDYDEELRDFQPQFRKIMENSLEAMELLNQEVEKDAARIPEDVFVDYLLPVLTNRSGKQSLVRWQQVAGHVMRPLDVFDLRTKEVLFRVPPILRRINLSFTNGNAIPIRRLMETAEQKSRVIPALGDKYIQTQLVEKMGHVSASASVVIAWNAILKRYGYPPVINLDFIVPPEEHSEAILEPGDIEVEGFDDF